MARPNPLSLRRRMLNAASATVVAAAVTLVGWPAPAHADAPEGFPDQPWAACTDAEELYCIEEATLTPVDGEPTPVTDLGLNATVVSHAGDGSSLDWGVEGYYDATPAEVRDGEVRLVLRTGYFVPRYTTSVARDVEIDTYTDGAGVSTMTITGRAIATDWTSDSELVDSCVTAGECGGEDTMTFNTSTPYYFLGHTESLAGDPAAGQALAGMYVATGGQTRPSVPTLTAGEEPSLSIRLGNPHLSAAGDPIRGPLAAWLPPAYFASLDTTAEAAAEVGFDVVTGTGEAAASVPATARLHSGGVALEVADLDYSARDLTIVHRAPTAVDGATVPDRPQDVSATAGSPTDEGMAGMEVSWSAPETDGGLPVTSYTARAFTVSDDYVQFEGRCSATGTSCTIPGLYYAATYHVAVSASNGLGEGPGTNPRLVVVLEAAPGAPESVNLMPGDGMIDVWWNPPEQHLGSVPTGYTARAYVAATGGSAVASCESTGEEYGCTLTGLTNGTEYFVAVSATNQAGTGPETSPRAAATPAAPPSAPRSVTVTPGNGQLTVSWTAPESTGGLPLTGYVAVAYTDPEPPEDPWDQEDPGDPGEDPADPGDPEDPEANAAGDAPEYQGCDSDGDTLSCTVTGLENGVTYYVAVNAHHDSGEGPESDPRVAGTPRSAPSAPRSVTAAARNGSLAVAWLAPLSTGGAALTGYTARAYTAASGGNVAGSCTTPAGTRACTLTGLSNGVRYHVAVTAANAVGSGPASGPRVAGTPRTVPGAPRSVKLSTSGGKVKVSWTAPASTGGAAVTGYVAKLYAARSGGSPVAQCTAGASGRSCTTGALKVGRTYYVGVVATNNAGSSNASARLAVVVKR